MSQLDTPASDEWVIGCHQLHQGLSRNLSARFRDYAAIDFDLAGQNQGPGALSRGCQATLEDNNV
jgi:hypothetical protein